MPINQKGIAHFLILVLVILGIAVGLYLVQNPTVFNPKASGLSQTSPLGLISANPNPCFIAAGSNTCSSTISWNAEDRPDVKIKIREVPDLTFAQGPLGSQAAPWITATGITFDLYSGNTLVDSLFVQGSSSAPTAAPTVSTLSNGLIAYWNLNETSGNVARDYTGVNNLSILNTRPTEGKFGKARNFGNPWEYLQVNSLRNGSKTTMTASAWAYTVLQPTTTSQNIVFQSASWGLYLGKLNLPTFSIFEINGSQQNWIYCTGKKPVSPNEWNLLTASFDGTNIKIYVNGMLENTCPYSGRRYNYNDTAYVGYQGDSKSPFIGNIDEVAIWDRALSQDEITALAGGAIPAQVPFSIEASPNPCTIPAGQSTCTSKITWYSNYPDLKIKIKETSGSFASGASGSQDAPWITATGATFEAYSGSALVGSLFVKGAATGAGSSPSTPGTSPSAVYGGNNLLSASPSPCNLNGSGTCTTYVSWNLCGTNNQGRASYAGSTITLRVKEAPGAIVANSCSQNQLTIPWITSAGATLELYSNERRIDSLFIKGN